MPLITLFTLLLFLVTSGCKSQVPADVKKVLDAALDHAEEASMYRNVVDWSVLRNEVYSLAQDADSVSHLAPALNHLLEQLGDEHGRFFYDNSLLAFYNGPPQKHLENLSSDVYNDIQSGQVYNFEAALIEPGVGYVRIVGLPMGDNIKMSESIQEAVCEQHGKGARDWIVDLRYNGGGNMFPMVEGLASIIGDGPAGGAVGLTEAENSVWRVEDGDFYYDEQSVQLPNDCAYEVLPKVAVLTSMYTASSGEVVAVVFKGREKTRFFGEPTLGLTTVNDWTPIDSTSTLLLSVGTYQSRDGVVHSEYVDPDEHIAFMPGVDLSEDLGIKRALEWLSETED